MHKFSYKNGYTVFELLLAIALAAILYFSAEPLHKIVSNYVNRSLESNQILHALQYARGEAINRKATVSVCPSGNGSKCDDNWQKGYIVFVDNNSNGNCEADEEVLKIFLASKIPVTYNGFPSDNYISFLDTGLSHNNGKFTFGDKANKFNNLEYVIVSQSGRVRWERD